MKLKKNPAAWRAGGVLNAIASLRSTPRSIIEIADSIKLNFAALAAINPAAFVALCSLALGEARR